MKKIPNYLVNELIRLIPVLIENIPHEGRSTRVDNAIRLTNKIVKRRSEKRVGSLVLQR